MAHDHRPDVAAPRPDGHTVAVAERPDRPPLMLVKLLNDDETPFDFVEDVVREVFGKSIPEAQEIATLVHSQGSAVVGAYPEAEAIDHVDHVHVLAVVQGFPLRATVSPAG